MSRGVAFLGAASPEALVITVSSGNTGVDLSSSSFTGASLAVKRADGTTATWAVSLSGQSATSVTLTHVFGALDLTVPGTYVVVATLTGPAGPRRCLPGYLLVKDPFEV